MPTQSRSITETVQNLKSELSLTDGTTYDIQNTGNSDLLYRENAATPAVTLEDEQWTVLPARIDRGYGVEYFSTPYKPASGQNLYVKARAGQTYVVVNEAV